MTVAFVHNDDLAGFDYGPGHPLRIERLRLCTALMREYGLLDHPRLMAVEAQPAPREALLTFHHPDYLDVLEKADDGRMPENGAAFGLGVNDNPVFPGMWRWSRLLAGSSLMAARVVADGVVPTAFSISGGMHHAQHVTASGFCYINDIVVAINHLLSRGRRVAYVDIDVHHGDGVQDAYYHTDQVLTVSLHQHPRTLFPHTGSFEEMGYGLGRGFSVNLPLWPYTDDDVFVWSFDQIVPPLLRAYRPDVLVTQMGVDTLSDDPLADLQLTDSALMHACRVFAGMGLPWVILGGLSGAWMPPGWTIGGSLRRAQAAWALGAWRRCREAGVPFFLKPEVETGVDSPRLREFPAAMRQPPTTTPAATTAPLERQAGLF